MKHCRRGTWLLDVSPLGFFGSATIIVFLWGCIQVVAAERADERQPITCDSATVDLDGEWQFAYTPKHAEQVPEAKLFTAAMPIPGCWDDQFDRAKAKSLWPDVRFNPDYRPIRLPIVGQTFDLPDTSLPFITGTGWYRRRLDVPAEWRGRQVTLQVGRVVMEGWVYVNGRMVHHHFGHSTNWETPLGPHLNYGQANELVIAVDNTRTDRSGCVIRGWQGRSGGIFAPVSILLAGTTRIADLYVFPANEQLQWRVELEGDLPRSAELHWRIVEPETNRIMSQGVETIATAQAQWTSNPEGLKPWSDRQPTLYRLEARLIDGGKCVDVRRQMFGMRRMVAQGTGLRLNGRPILLRGYCDTKYYPTTCTPPTNIEWYRRHIKRLKEIGFNWMRCHTSVPLEVELQAADELGMLVQVEAPVGFQLPEWRDILRACRRHPSVVLYCCGNEELLDEAKIEYLRRCAAELRAIAPDALFNPQEELRGIDCLWSRKDLGPAEDVVQQPFRHNPKRLAAVREFSDVFAQNTWGWLAYTSLQGDAAELDRRLAFYGKPCLTHELGVYGCYPDLGLEPRYRRLRIGADLFSGARDELRKAGLLERAEVYHRHSAVWQWLMFKDAMESARLCRNIAGYDCLGANDAHWLLAGGYGCGLLNEFDELKSGRTVDDILAANGESVLLLSQQRRRNLKSGEPFRRDILLSWFGEGTLRDAALHWSLAARDGATLGASRQTVAPVEAGGIVPVAAINLTLPQSDRPEKLLLKVELTAGNVHIRNQWPFWLFPAVAGRPPFDANQILVVEELDAAARQALADGKRVVLLGAKPFPVAPLDFQMGTAGRPLANFATIIARHPLTDQFPHDGYCDWQFAPMLSGAKSVQFNAAAEAFDPLIEIASSFKQIRRQAALFEWRVGDGRLLACTLNLPDDDPAAAWFRRCMLNYAASDRFEPRTKMSLERLERFMEDVPPTVPNVGGTGQPGEDLNKTPAKSN